MKTIRFLILDALGYLLFTVGIGGILLGLAFVISHDNRGWILFVAGLLVIPVGLTITYIAVDKNKRRFKAKLLENFIIDLLPPWR